MDISALMVNIPYKDIPICCFTSSQTVITLCGGKNKYLDIFNIDIIEYVWKDT